MHYKVFKGLWIISFICCCCDSIGIDGKLDFGDSHSSYPSFRNQDSESTNTFVPRKITNTIKNVETSNNFDNIGIVCVSTGCNTTKSVNSDNIQTDVVVHVSTKVDIKNNTSVVGDTPDIPVVIGYKGSQLDSTRDEENIEKDRNLNPIVVTGFDSLPKIPSYNSYAPTGSYNPKFGVSYPPLVNSRTDSSFGRSYNNFDPSTRDNSFYTTRISDKNEPTININIKTLPAVTISMSEILGDKFKNTPIKTNGINSNIPYLQPAFHSHYFGEQPPPQLAWYPKKSSSFNPVEFNAMKSSWIPSTWNQRIMPHRHTSTTVGMGVQCHCTTGHTEPGLRWYPDSNKGISTNDPGSQINDKLAPLN